MIDRPYGIDWLWKWKDQEPIKVVTGIRRCGKSTLLSMFQNQLTESGIDDGQIVAINFEHPDFIELDNSASVWKYLKPRIFKGRTTYVFLDEIQRVKDFEKVVDGLFTLPDVDVYITGSNSYLLSGELATYLSGRYVTLHLMPLSFQEYYRGVASGGSPERAYRDYLAFTSFPHNRAWDTEPSLVADYLEGIVNTARSRLRDRRHERRGSFTIRPRPPSRSPSTRRSRPTAKMRKRPIVLDVTFRRFACKQDETVKKGDLT